MAGCDRRERSGEGYSGYARIGVLRPPLASNAPTRVTRRARTDLCARVKGLRQGPTSTSSMNREESKMKKKRKILTKEEMEEAEREKKKVEKQRAWEKATREERREKLRWLTGFPPGTRESYIARRLVEGYEDKDELAEALEADRVTIARVERKLRRLGYARETVTRWRPTSDRIDEFRYERRTAKPPGKVPF